MLTDIVANGIIIFVAFWLLWFKLNPVLRLRLLNHIFLVDLVTFILIFFMYSGSATGALAASVATIFISLSLSYGRRRYGYIKKNRYFGANAKINMGPEIARHYQRREHEKAGVTSIHRGGTR